MKTPWQNKTVMFHKECTHKCYNTDPKCANCPQENTISDRNFRNALIVLVFVVTVIMTLMMANL